MNILDTLKLPIFTLPKQSSEDTFPLFLKKIFKEFLTTLDQIDEGTIVEKLKVNRQTLRKVCNLLIKSSKTYFSGFPSKAYFEFEKAMSLIEDFLILKNVGVVFDEHTPYYRARKGNGKQFERHEMFHIPFEEREKVTNQRFSVPGLPCLYLSNSTYVCWEELRRPDISKMQISRYKLENKRYKFLDISLTPDLMCKILTSVSSKESADFAKKTQKEALDSWDKGSLNFIMRWPLIAACSVKVKKDKGAFKPEYIFPQFLLQWVSHTKKFDGVKYFSVEANMFQNFDYSKLINYAIPVKTTLSKGYCKDLKDSFSLTKPVSWEVLTIINPQITNHDQEKFSKNITKLGLDVTGSIFKLIDGKPVLYCHSIFGKLEIELAEMEFSKI
ncbi:MAG: hypothetical protein ACT4OJ_12360 [Bacteroidota bacterium]